MEYRRLGASGLKVPVFSFGTATFGGGDAFFRAWGTTQTAEAKRLTDICIESGLNFFDTANVYSQGMAESILGQVLEGRRNQVLISTKSTFAMGDQPNDFGSSRWNIVKSCEASLKRLRTNWIDLYHMHGFDPSTPVEETLRALDDLVQSGKVRYIACSNFSGWHLMKSLSISERHGWSRYVSHQVYYSLVGREFEWELMPLALDQGVATMVWSPLAGGALTGKIRRSKPAPEGSRVGSIDFIPFDSETLYRVVDTLEIVGLERSKSISQVALNWLLQRPTVANIVIGCRNEEQLRHNLGALGWSLTPAEIKRLDEASARPVLYPYWHQHSIPGLNPPVV